MNFTDDCRNVVERMVTAYKLKTVKALSDRLNVGVSVISNRINRNTFPSDLVIQCALETGANLLWLCTGKGDAGISDITTNYSGLMSVPRYLLVNGKLNEMKNADLDRTMLPDEINTPEIVKLGTTHYVVDKKFDITNGKYVIAIEGSTGIYDLYRVPVNKVVISGGNLPKELELNIDDITVFAKIAVVMHEV